ncbi:DUF554 domain-containing protein [Streptococcus hillyeri]|uniref:DUF554 domain-containing protein n=1 Tax=Streptococcus hillyeri TaxID=2282420 RepID=A0A3L9DVX5_9STRE|nr:DUF554 domain-containing protein [Streptococcus hillyeri]RLY05235.1 DUF554 domain-containing protein [Streptococcus hillyeri]
MGAIVNAICIVVGAGLGLVIQKGLSQRFHDILMKGMSLCVVVIGIQGAIEASNTMLLILALLFGALLGEALNIEKAMEDLSYKLEKTLVKNPKESQFAQGFLSAIMIFCVGAMAIVGSLQSGLLGDHSMLYSKGIIDGIIAVLLASTNGVGVLFSAIAVLLYEVTMTLLAGVLGTYLSEDVISAMSSTGSVLLIALGFNMLDITKFKVMNYIPAVFLPILLLPILKWLGLF